MIEVVGVTLQEDGKIYYFSPNNFKLFKNQTVLVETEQGIQFGKIKYPVKKISKKFLKGPLKSIKRISTKQDNQRHQQNLQDSKKALKKARETSKKLKMKIQILDASYLFDRDKLIFRFISDSRVDFRELAKELATVYKTRIELRQIGVRDKAREIGGCGQCGRPLCCNKFLKNMNSVSIKMAKNQKISLNPNKINGACGRLMCCLKYENETYTETKNELKNIGEKINTEYGLGKIIDVDIIKKEYKVETKKNGIVKIKHGS